jgi:hypothetical protein
MASSGMNDVLGQRLREIPGVACPPAFKHTQWRIVVDKIKQQPKGSRTVVAGHSMGAASATWITDFVPVDLLVLYDLAGQKPSLIGRNTKLCIDVYDTAPDLVPETRVQAVAGYEKRIKRWTTNYGHGGQDDGVELANEIAKLVEDLTHKGD